MFAEVRGDQRVSGIINGNFSKQTFNMNKILAVILVTSLCLCLSEAGNFYQKQRYRNFGGRSADSMQARAALLNKLYRRTFLADSGEWQNGYKREDEDWF